MVSHRKKDIQKNVPPLYQYQYQMVHIIQYIHYGLIGADHCCLPDLTHSVAFCQRGCSLR